MKTAQNYLNDSASGELRSGFNCRIYNESFSECMSGIPHGSRWGERNAGWELANEAILAGRIFSEKQKVEFKCQKDGNMYCCFGPDFIDLQESDNYVFAETFEKAVDLFIKKTLAPTQ